MYNTRRHQRPMRCGYRLGEGENPNPPATTEEEAQDAAPPSKLKAALQVINDVGTNTNKIISAAKGTGPGGYAPASGARPPASTSTNFTTPLMIGLGVLGVALAARSA